MIRNIAGDTRLLGLLGQGTSYSLSPAIHNCAIGKLYLNQVYVNFELPAGSIDNFLKVFWELGGVGLNVTKPYKTIVPLFLNHCALTSVNTIFRGKERWEGYSTDGEGFERGLLRIGIDLVDISHLILLGSGGAAQSLMNHVAAMPGSNLQSIHVVRRSNQNDSSIKSVVADHVGLHFYPWTCADFSLAVGKTQEGKALMIQATSGPQQGASLDELSPGLRHYQGAFVDLIYDRPSRLYYDAMNMGLKCQDGLAMLIEQARLSQEIWWGKSASFDELAQAVKQTGQFSGPNR
ncbi:MAG: hypothetical protein NTV34_18530 [Proteobacteria bacterium]|nr:hypothetical protein [Pseudomonadota bacterium]